MDPFTYAGGYISYKQAYLEIVYYISKMKEIGYNYIPNGETPKVQYRQVKDIYDSIMKLEKLKDHPLQFFYTSKNC